MYPLGHRVALCYCYVCMSTLCLAIKNFDPEKPQRKWPVAVYYIRVQTDFMSRVLVICFLNRLLLFYFYRYHQRLICPV